MQTQWWQELDKCTLMYTNGQSVAINAFHKSKSIPILSVLPCFILIKKYTVFCFKATSLCVQKR